MANWITGATNKAKNGVKNTTRAVKNMFDNPNYNPEKTHFRTLDIIKHKNYENEYSKLWNILKQSNEKLDLNPTQKDDINLDNIIKGNAKLYSQNIFRNTANNFIETLKNEVVSSYNFFDSSKDEKEVVNNSFENIAFDLKSEILNEDLEELFEFYYKYDYFYIKIDVINGETKLSFLNSYQIIESEQLYHILEIENGEYEYTTRDKELSLINNKETNLKNVGILKINGLGKLLKNIETILEYDVISSTITKEVMINSSKLFIDKALNGTNPINKDIITLLDIPESEFVGEEAKKSNIDMFSGKNSLSEIVQSLEIKSKQIVNVFGLSKKTLGLEAGGQDFASSLPYENDLTAKTINDLRLKIKFVVDYLILYLTENENIVIKFEKYSLESKEAVNDLNGKSIKNKTMSVREAKADQLNLDLDDEEVLKQTVLIKIDHNMTLDYIEDEYARKNKMLPNFDGELA